MAKIKNPILPGFNPDPSILRVGDDYYIATSTFEWFPGVQIHHSGDLVNWRLLARPLDRRSQLDMVGNPCSCGIWAPCLSYSDGLFWLVYTDVKVCGIIKDTPNYLVTAPSITGPWSDPIFLNASGFDPSLFHDDDGKKWVVNMLNDPRKGRTRFAGILLQEYSQAEKRLVGPIKNIFNGPIGYTEGPHLYKHNGWYYLMTAEGGTGYNHAVTVARSRNIDGPYEVDPTNPILTAKDRPELPLQKSGHASLVETADGQWYLAYLCGRPINVDDGKYKWTRRCILGRETSLQKCKWTDDGWLRLADGSNAPAVEIDGPNLPEHNWPTPAATDDFDSPELNINFQSLRIQIEESWATLKAKPGHLRLVGRQSLSSRHYQSLLARRVQHFHCQAATAMDFAPTTFLQSAGLVAYYNVRNWIYLQISHDDAKGRVLTIQTCQCGQLDEPICGNEIALPDGKIALRATIDRDRIKFFYAEGVDKFSDAIQWRQVGEEMDCSFLSDECAEAGPLGGTFTGAFVGICCQDLEGYRASADFDWFHYSQTAE